MKKPEDLLIECINGHNEKIKIVDGFCFERENGEREVVIEIEEICLDIEKLEKIHDWLTKAIQWKKIID